MESNYLPQEGHADDSNHSTRSVEVFDSTKTWEPPEDPCVENLTLRHHQDQLTSHEGFSINSGCKNDQSRLRMQLDLKNEQRIELGCAEKSSEKEVGRCHEAMTPTQVNPTASVGHCSHANRKFYAEASKQFFTNNTPSVQPNQQNEFGRGCSLSQREGVIDEKHHSSIDIERHSAQQSNYQGNAVRKKNPQVITIDDSSERAVSINVSQKASLLESAPPSHRSTSPKEIEQSSVDYRAKFVPPPQPKQPKIMYQRSPESTLSKTAENSANSFHIVNQKGVRLLSSGRDEFRALDDGARESKKRNLDTITSRSTKRLLLPPIVLAATKTTKAHSNSNNMRKVISQNSSENSGRLHVGNTGTPSTNLPPSLPKNRAAASTTKVKMAMQNMNEEKSTTQLDSKPSCSMKDASDYSDTPSGGEEPEGRKVNISKSTTHSPTSSTQSQPLQSTSLTPTTSNAQEMPHRCQPRKQPIFNSTGKSIAKGDSYLSKSSLPQISNGKTDNIRAKSHSQSTLICGAENGKVSSSITVNQMILKGSTSNVARLKSSSSKICVQASQNGDSHNSTLSNGNDIAKNSPKKWIVLESIKSRKTERDDPPEVIVIDDESECNTPGLDEFNSSEHESTSSEDHSETSLYGSQNKEQRQRSYNSSPPPSLETQTKQKTLSNVCNENSKSAMNAPKNINQYTQQLSHYSLDESGDFADSIRGPPPLLPSLQQTSVESVALAYKAQVNYCTRTRNPHNMYGNSEPVSRKPSLVSSPSVTWNIREIDPPLSPLIISFLTGSAGIDTVKDLLHAQTSKLCMQLLCYNGFKVACCWMAWRQNKKICEIRRLKLARTSIGWWKSLASKWWTQKTGSEWNSLAYYQCPYSQAKENTNKRIIPTATKESLENILCLHEAMILEKNLNIRSVSQLVAADKQILKAQLALTLRDNFVGRSQQEVELICEGMLYTWDMRARELLDENGPRKSISSVSSASEEGQKSPHSKNSSRTKSIFSASETTNAHHEHKKVSRYSVSSLIEPPAKNQTQIHFDSASPESPGPTSPVYAASPTVITSNHREPKKVSHCQNSFYPKRSLPSLNAASIQRKPTKSSRQNFSQSQPSPRKRTCSVSCSLPFSLTTTLNSTAEALTGVSRNDDGDTFFVTPLSYTELYFIKSLGIRSDSQLLSLERDESVLASQYAEFLDKVNLDISPQRAAKTVASWRIKSIQAMDDGTRNEPHSPRTTRLDPRCTCIGPERLRVMDNVLHLCKTVRDENSGGLPMRTVISYDCFNHVLYEFLIRIKNSACGPHAGKGAFLTFKGAKVLKESSRKKCKKFTRKPPNPQTRKSLKALYPNGRGVSVTLHGSNLHGDEIYYGPKTNDSVGFWNEFSLREDFQDSDDNITFSSRHPGCGLVELDRYAPLLPGDRKTDIVFSVKDFIFSFEPSSWRFDVSESLNGYHQVVDFTDDTTGAPHTVAQSNVAMYVNEVGHNIKLVENVCSLEKPRSVYYYASIDTPMKKGETVELLVNYKEGYESMRVRRGYGKANLLGVKSDNDDYTRVQRNLAERFSLEDSIKSYREDEVGSVIDFLENRVWYGILSATSCIPSVESPDDKFDATRQFIARRRLDWTSRILGNHYSGLGRDNSHKETHHEADSIFKVGMIVYVNNWMEAQDPRPPYSGVATVNNVFRDEFDRVCLGVSLPGGKSICCVPEGAISEPTDDDFVEAPRRMHSNWLKWKKEQSQPQYRDSRHFFLEKMHWDSSHFRNLLSNQSSSGMHTRIVESLRWEVSEELLYLLVKDNRLHHPLNDRHWCPISMRLLVKSLHTVADYIIPTHGRKESSYEEMLSACAEKLLSILCEATVAVRNIISILALETKKNEENLQGYLAFNETSKSESGAQKFSRYLKAESEETPHVSVENCSKGQITLDENFYLIHQVLFVTHALASLIDWNGFDNRGKIAYSFEEACKCAAIDVHLAERSQTVKSRSWRPLIVLPH